MSNNTNRPGRGQTAITHVRQLTGDNNNADLGTQTPTIEQKLETAMSEITKLTNDKAKLLDQVGDFIPNGHVMIPLEKYQLLQEVLREHNAIMPLIIVAEATTAKLLDKEKLKDYTAEQTMLIDTAFTTPDAVFYSHMDAWIKRNPEYGFSFAFEKDNKAKAS